MEIGSNWGESKSRDWDERRCEETAWKANRGERGRDPGENHFRFGNEREAAVGAVTMVIIVDAEISILQLMHRPESGCRCLCAPAGGQGQEEATGGSCARIDTRNHRRVSGKLRRREPTRNHHKGSVLPLIPVR